MPSTILTNARLVLENDIVKGSIEFDASGIVSLDKGPTQISRAEDVGGDYIVPGLIDIHTDEMERHFIPRPGVHWPDAAAAVLAYDAQMAASGVTTVYDCIRAGGYGAESRERSAMLFQMLDAVTAVESAGVGKAEHIIHLRCETSDPKFEDYLPPLADYPLIQLVSIMDHTPGERQFRDIEKLKQLATRSGKSAAEIEEDIVVRRREGVVVSAANREKALAFWSDRGVVLASHDDTTVEHIRQSHAENIRISEFPCTLEAAAEAKKLGLATVGGAPNAVRGGSHSGNISAEALAEADTLTALSSDYVPASLLQAPFCFAARRGTPLHRELGRVTWAVADMLGLEDRGRLQAGHRADLIRVAEIDSTPFTRAYWRGGEKRF